MKTIRKNPFTMNSFSFSPTLVLLLTLTAIEATAEASELTYTDLVERLYDMKALATPPVSGEKSGCFSRTLRAFWIWSSRLTPVCS